MRGIAVKNPEIPRTKVFFCLCDTPGHRLLIQKRSHCPQLTLNANLDVLDVL